MVEAFVQYAAGYGGAAVVLLTVRRVVVRRRARRLAGEWTVSPRSIELLRRQGAGRG